LVVVLEVLVFVRVTAEDRLGRISGSTPTNVARSETLTLPATSVSALILLAFFVVIVEFFAVSSFRGSSASTASIETSTSEASSTLVGGVGGAFDRAPVGSGHVGGFISLFADDNVKLDEFAVSDATDGLLRVVPDDGGLVDKDVLFGVVAVDETVAGFYVEPLNGAGHFLGNDLFRFFVLSVGGGRWIGSVRVGLRRCRQVLRVGHDGKMVSLTTLAEKRRSVF